MVYGCPSCAQELGDLAGLTVLLGDGALSLIYAGHCFPCTVASLRWQDRLYNTAFPLLMIRQMCPPCLRHAVSSRSAPSLGHQVQ